MMRWYWSNFLGPCAAEDAPGACAPLNAELSGLPPLYLNAAGLDPLLDDTSLLAARLRFAHPRTLHPGDPRAPAIPARSPEPTG